MAVTATPKQRQDKAPDTWDGADKTWDEDAPTWDSPAMPAWEDWGRSRPKREGD